MISLRSFLRQKVFLVKIALFGMIKTLQYKLLMELILYLNRLITTMSYQDQINTNLMERGKY